VHKQLNYKGKHDEQVTQSLIDGGEDEEDDHSRERLDQMETQPFKTKKKKL
jgi:hypothetical protein